MDEPPPFTRKQESLTFAALTWTVALSGVGVKNPCG